MPRVHLYRTYNWIDKDPIIDAVRTVVQDEKLKSSAVHNISGVSATTLESWFSGHVRKPQNATLTAVTSALGYVRRDRLNGDGTVTVAFEKARALNWSKEIEKQAGFVLKHGTAKQKKLIAKQKKNAGS
jgi:hypothetical protein